MTFPSRALYVVAPSLPQLPEQASTKTVSRPGLRGWCAPPLARSTAGLCLWRSLAGQQTADLSALLRQRAAMGTRERYSGCQLCQRLPGVERDLAWPGEEEGCDGNHDDAHFLARA